MQNYMNFITFTKLFFPDDCHRFMRCQCSKIAYGDEEIMAKGPFKNINRQISRVSDPLLPQITFSYVLLNLLLPFICI